MRFVASCRRGAMVTALVLTPTLASAQAPADSFSDVPRMVENGRKVVVTDFDGQKTKGTIAEITPTSLTLLVRDKWGTEHRRVFADNTVRAINRTDSIWNGLLIGTGAGIVASELFVRHNCGPRGYDNECAAIVTAIGWVTFVPGGATVGALIDRFSGNKLLYRARSTGSTLSISPVVSPGARGVSIALRF